ncbi:hypothetical protein B0H10DRAFT_2188590 [Mycena sp. CBHHK59/15]|nr:hypothetical protein B0H10DRAFT_2188590 [Mycena sp. CBHHK59/15]
MLYRIEIDRKYLHTMSEYQDLKIESPLHKWPKLPTITLKEAVDYREHLGAHAIEHCILNGMWAVFIHTKTGGTAVGSWAVIYRMEIGIESSGTEFFAGWQARTLSSSLTFYLADTNRDPWNSQVVVEVFEPGHWFNATTKKYMLQLLDNHNGQTSDHTNLGYIYSIYGSTGNQTTAYIEYVSEKKTNYCSFE